MARQTGPITIQGSIGELNFYKKDGVPLVRRKYRIDPDKLRTHPRYERTREHITEFYSVSPVARQIRHSLNPFLYRIADSNMHNRLTKQLFKILLTDSTAARGERRVWRGDWQLLNRFEFNISASFRQRFLSGFSFTRNVQDAESIFNCSTIIPTEEIDSPAAATHFRLYIGIVQPDSKTEQIHILTHSTEHFKLGNEPIQLDNIKFKLPDATGIYLNVIAIDFWQFENGQFYCLRNEKFNAGCIIIRF